jgi:hypothetical protein
VLVQDPPQAALDLLLDVTLSDERVLDAGPVEDEEAIPEAEVEGFLHTLYSHSTFPRLYASPRCWR